MTLFDVGDPLPPPPPDTRSYTVKLTERRAELLAAGVHPATRRKLLVVAVGQVGPRCGSCMHHVVHRHAKTYHKCKIAKGGLTSGPASDIRITWPACELFHPRDSDG